MTTSSKKRKINIAESCQPSKIPSLEALSIESPSILVLNDDCFGEIFDLLDMKSLCDLHRVCKRLQLLTTSHFKNKFASKWIQCKFESNRNVRLFPDEDHIKYFKCFIRNVIIESHTAQIFDMGFLRSKTEENNFKQVQFKSIDFSRASHREHFSKILNNVDTIGFFECWMVPESILKSCDSLKNLIFSANSSCSWIFTLSIPTLEQLQCFDCSELLCEKMPQFVRRHPNLKSLTLQFQNKYSYSDPVEKIIKAIFECGYSLEEMFISFEISINVDRIHRELEAICSRGTIKRLEIQFKWIVYEREDGFPEDFHKFSSLTKLTGLHLHMSKNSIDLPNFCPDILLFTNLKILHLDGNFMMTDFDSEDLAKSLINLEQLYFNVNCFYTTNIKRIRKWKSDMVLDPVCDANELITPFVIHSIKLNTLAIVNDITDEQQNIPRLRFWRNKLTDVTKLTIFLKKFTFRKFIKSIEFVNAKEGSVKVKEVSIIEDVMNIKTPFIQYYCDEL